MHQQNSGIQGRGTCGWALQRLLGKPDWGSKCTDNPLKNNKRLCENKLSSATSC